MQILNVDTPPAPLRQVTLVLDEEEAAFLTDLLGKCNGSTPYGIFSPLSELDDAEHFRRKVNIDGLPVIDINSREKA